MKTIAIVNRKGGTGKTITAVNMAADLAKYHGKRVLLIDVDSQGNASQMLLGDTEETNTVSDLLMGRTSYYEELIYHSQYKNLDVIPADDRLMDFDIDGLMRGNGALNGLRDLRDAIIEDDAYDYVIFDCPPQFTASCVAAISAAESIIIPIKIDRFSVRGMQSLTRHIDRIRKIHPEIRVAGCLVTMWYKSDLTLQGEQALRDRLLVPMFDTVIRRSAKVDESTWLGGPLFDTSPRSSACRNYRSWVSEYLAIEEARTNG